MTNRRNVSQNEVAGFLLGLGMGLVVGLLFHSQPPDRALLEDKTSKAGRSALSTPKRDSSALEMSLFS
jgi:hypothetical protein